MRDEHSDDLEPEVDESAEIETEQFTAADDDDDVEIGTALPERDGDLTDDIDHDHDDSM